MTSKFQIINSDEHNWTPSSFYSDKITLIWVFKYSLFKKIYTGKIKSPTCKKYAIHRDVYKAFKELYKNRQLRKTRKN